MENKKKQNEEQQPAELSGEELEQAAGGVIEREGFSPVSDLRKYLNCGEEPSQVTGDGQDGAGGTADTTPEQKPAAQPFFVF